jgi:hypothetical protein
VDERVNFIAVSFSFTTGFFRLNHILRPPLFGLPLIRSEIKFIIMKTVFLTFSILYLTSIGNLIYAQEKLESFMNESTPEERAQLQTDYMK